MFKYSIKINESDFFYAASKEIQKVVSDSISYAIKKTRSLFINEIKKALMEDKTYDQLVNYDDTLFFDIGLPNIGSIRDDIVDFISKSFNLRKIPPRSNDLGGFSIVILKDGIQQLFSMPYASYSSKNGQVDWLEWLLTEGTNEVVSNYKVLYGNFSKWSRTGEAIMVPSKTGGFRFDTDHAGTLDDNWITRSLKRLESRMTNIFEEIINNYIQT